MTEPSTGRFRGLLYDGLIALALAVVVLVGYVLTLAPGLLMNDSGEFQTLVATLGHTHPTGYPVYLLLSRPVTFLPLHDVAWRVNLSSAIAATMTVTGLFLVGRILTGRRWLPLAAAVALALSPTFWSQAIIAEVYAPAAAMMVAVLLSLAVWQRCEQTRWLLAAGLIGGLSLGVHMSVALMAPAAMLFVLSIPKDRWRNVCAAVCGAVIGCVLTLAAFVVIDSSQPPSDYFQAVIEPSRSEWGLEADDLDGLVDRLRFSLAAVQYRDNLHRPTATDLLRQLNSYRENLPRELSWLWLVIAAVGAVRMTRSNGRFAMLLGLTLAAHLAYVIHHDMGDIHVAYLPTYVVLTLFGAAGLGVVAAPTDQPNAERSRRHPAIEVVVSLVLVARTLFPLVTDDHFMSTGRPRFWVPPGEPPFEVDDAEKLHRQLTACVAELEDDAVVLTEWALLYPFYYVAHVDQQRTGMTFVQTYPAIGQTRLADTAVEFIRQQSQTRPVYLSERLPELAEEFTFESVRPGGLLMFRLRSRPQTARRSPPVP